MRLDHLLSKEHLASRPMSDVRADRSKTPGRCTGYSVGDPAGEISLVRLVRGPRSRGDRAGSGTRLTVDVRTGRAHCSALGVRASEHLENSITSASIYSQVTKGLRWMPWRQEPMKDASGCEKLRGAAEKAEIRRCPNGETRPGSCPVIHD